MDRAHNRILEITALILMIIFCINAIAHEYCRAFGDYLTPGLCSCLEHKPKQ